MEDSSQSNALVRCVTKESSETIKAMIQAFRSPRTSNVAVTSKSKPIINTSKLEACMIWVGIYCLSKRIRDAMGGVMAERIFITPNKNISTTGANLKKICLPLAANAKRPADNGNQNSKMRYKMVISKACAGL